MAFSTVQLAYLVVKRPDAACPSCTAGAAAAPDGAATCTLAAPVPTPHPFAGIPVAALAGDRLCPFLAGEEPSAVAGTYEHSGSVGLLAGQ